MNDMNYKLNLAYQLASIRHKNQTRKDGSQYINHPIRVVELAKEYFRENNNLNELEIAAFLHDTIEDTNTTLDEIKKIFGCYVAYLVDGVTSNKEIKNKMGKTKYLCFKLVNMNEDVLDLKLCDRLANVKDLINAPDEFKEKYSLETITILNYLLNNREVTDVQKKIINDIKMEINKLRTQKTLKLSITV